MTIQRPANERRPAFTLIELLVVIAIIAILMSLLAAAVVNMLRKGPEAQARSDIGDMDMQMSKMASQFNLKSVPSQLHLSKQNNYGNTQLDLDSKAFLQTRFGRECCYRFKPLSGNSFIDWNGDGVANEELYLEGEQVLVFLLGGIPQYSGNVIGMTGTSNNITDPSQKGGTRQGPYFEFQSARLQLRPANPNNNKIQFPVYIDAYNSKTAPQPYLFFASYTQEGNGGYNRYGAPDTYVPNVQPYYTQAATQTTPTLYVNPGTWQILCAGADGKFGPGGLWNPAGPNVPQQGQDDQANFSPRRLGAAAN